MRVIAIASGLLRKVLTEACCRFNKTQQQFTNDEEWFDYQELVEDHSKLSSNFPLSMRVEAVQPVMPNMS